MNTSDSKKDSHDAYIAELRHALADLPRAEVDAIVEDVTPQLADAAVAEELGTPAELAAELRAAAGFPTGSTRRTLTARIALWVLVLATGTAAYGGFISNQLLSNDARYSMPVIALVLVASWFVVGQLGRDVAAVEELPEVRTARKLLFGAASSRMLGTLRLVELGWLLARFPLILIGTLLLAVQFGWNSGMAGVFAVAVAVVTTAAGYRSLTDRRWLWLSVPAGAWAIGVSLRLAVYLSLVVEGHIGYVNV
ncbi:hypothetical protein BLA60_27625 [Actinophytocola xinjiangensis]|uniref:Uncharacterized protein n=1 Tax=Actinophytocola xinjiangensis TaxID=485602 RepID=A0A7Z1AVZ6_9PSEU|nr:hypothetical protein [Actinophytocola xinjiangensis]OLF07344.1 hypothetical protein BLA60_27625 [Actinophytocola xinjiangensis]